MLRCTETAVGCILLTIAMWALLGGGMQAELWAVVDVLTWWSELREWLEAQIRFLFDTAAIADHYIGPLFRMLGAVVAFLGGLIAIYLKLRYAESQLNTRLMEFLARQDKRLTKENRSLSTTLVRPGPSLEFRSPVFTPRPVSRLARKLGFGRVASRPILTNKFKGRLWRADDDLQRSLNEIESQLTLLKETQTGYSNRQFSAHLLRGAIAAAKAADGNTEKIRDANTEALSHFPASVLPIWQ